MRQSIADAESTILNRQQTINDLSRRMNTVRLGGNGSPSRHTASSPQSSSYREFFSPAPSFLSPRSTSNLKVSPKVDAEIKEAISAQGRAQAIARRLKGRSVRVTGPDDIPTSDHVIDVDALGLPEGRDPQAGRQVIDDGKGKQTAAWVNAQAAAEHSAAPMSPVPSGLSAATSTNAFAGVTLNLNPGTVPSQFRNHGTVRTSKQSAPAAKYVPSVSGGSSAASPAPGGFDFGFNAPSPGSTAESVKQAPKGFFSFTNTGK